MRGGFVDEPTRRFREYLGMALVIMGLAVGLVAALVVPEYFALSNYIDDKYMIFVRIGAFAVVSFVFFWIGSGLASRSMIVTYEDQQDEKRRQERSEEN